MDAAAGRDARADAGGRDADPEPMVTVTVAVGGTGTGVVTSTPPGIACPGACTMTVPPGTAVAVQARADAPAVFTGWTGDCLGPGPGCQATATADLTFAGDFALGWTCAPATYGDGTCDCGCGLIDWDCADGTLASCQICDGLGSCSTQPCADSTVIDPVNNAACL